MLARDEWERRCNYITDQFFENVDMSLVNCLHVYLPIDNRNEPDLWMLIDRLKLENPSLKICVSKTIWKDHSLRHFQYESPAQLEMNKYGIPEPKEGIPVEDEEIDMVLVPLIAFDRRGNRIGYGGGFYDRFLEKLPDTCQRVGFTISTPLDYIPFMEDFDIALDGCICPLGTYWYN